MPNTRNFVVSTPKPGPTTPGHQPSGDDWRAGGADETKRHPWPLQEVAMMKPPRFGQIDYGRRGSLLHGGRRRGTRLHISEAIVLEFSRHLSPLRQRSTKPLGRSAALRHARLDAAARHLSTDAFNDTSSQELAPFLRAHTNTIGGCPGF
jgi:hypothetical protein